MLSKEKLIGIAGLPPSSQQDLAVNHTQEASVDIYWITANLDFTFIDPTLAIKPVRIRAVGGDATFIATSGTIEVASLTDGASIFLGPRPTGWFRL